MSTEHSSSKPESKDPVDEPRAESKDPVDKDPVEPKAEPVITLPVTFLRRVMEVTELSTNHLKFATKQGAYKDLEPGPQISVLNNIRRAEATATDLRSVLQGHHQDVK